MENAYKIKIIFDEEKQTTKAVWNYKTADEDTRFVNEFTSLYSIQYIWMKNLN